MKKLICTFLIVALIVSVFCINSVFAHAVNVTIDNVLQNYDVMPVIENGRTLVPVRFISESLGCKVDWNGKQWL